MSFIALQELAKSRSLPPGHIDKKKAEIHVATIYAACGKVERLWSRRFSRTNFRHIFDTTNAKAFCDQICDMLGERRLKAVLFNVKVPEGSGGVYTQREVRFPYICCCITELIHELAHHFDTSCSHNQSFCEVEDFLLRVAYELLTGKKLHSDW